MLAETFHDILHQHGARVAVSDPARTLTYRELDEQSARTAGELRHGTPTGDRIGLKAANSVGYVVCYLAAVRAGFTPFLIDASLGRDEVGRIVEECSLDLVLHDGTEAVGTTVGETMGLRISGFPRTPKRYEALPDTEVCRFTSGSTGKPNCIEFSGSAVTMAATNWVAGTGLRAEDRIACFAALSNGLAFNTSLLSAFLVGASLHLTRGLPTGGHIARLLARTGATRLVGFPALYESAVRRELDRVVFGSVRLAISSGAPLRPATREEFTALTGVPVSNYYGVAETGPLTFTAAPDGSGSLGSPLPGVRLAAGEADHPAEITVRSQSMGSRYLNAPGVFESRLDPNGDYRTGDEGYLDERGLFLTGRTSRMINVGGRKVDPIEVAEVLRRATGVHDAAVFEVTGRHGEPVVAAAVSGTAGLDESDLREHCAAALAAHKVPSFIRVVPAIPANAIGKPSLDRLRDLVTSVHMGRKGAENR